jgi:hypothetical protein
MANPIQLVWSSMQKSAKPFLVSSLLLLVLFFKAPFAYPCSSCGSGAADPLILNPMEQQKFYLDIGQQSRFKDVDSNGDFRRDLGPEVKRQMQIAFAQRLSDRLFASLVSGVGQNRRAGRSENGILDSTVNLRYTAWNQSMLNPWLPQMQFMLSHRFKTTRSVQDARKEYYLDSFGAGYGESFYGIDVWFGMLPVMFGGSVLRSQPWAADTKSGRLLPGIDQKEILSVGSMVLPELKIMGGLIRERRAVIRLDGSELANSDRVSHDLYLTGETSLAGLNNFRCTVSKRAAFGSNKNATQFVSVTTAWMRTL